MHSNIASDSVFGQWFWELVSTPAPAPALTEAGTVADVGDGVAVVSGLARALSDELVLFGSGVQGQVFDLEADRLGVVLLGPSELIQPGEPVYRTHKVVSVPVGPGLLGRVVDALGRPLDDKGAVVGLARAPVECEAPSIMERAPVARPLATGITAVDAAIPVGLGQRQLIIGDRQTGKTSLALDTLLNQKRSGLSCIYCAVGQRGDAVARIIGVLEKSSMLERSIVVVSGDEEAPGLAHIAPYAAMTMAEYFAAQQRDVLLIIDDMTHHARAYRELSLLLRRPPGREAFPGDIFHVHARLLERAGQFGGERGGGSITVLPVVETEAGNLSAYIPTNLISITDGQIYLSPRLVRRGQFPAVDLGLSVSRVGGKAQGRALRAISGNLRVTLSQFEELEDFVRFGTRLDDGVRARLARGAAVREALRQAERDPLSVVEQLAVLVAAMEGLFDGLSGAAIEEAMVQVRAAAGQALAEAQPRIAAGEALGDEERRRLVAAAQEVLRGAG